MRRLAVVALLAVASFFLMGSGCQQGAPAPHQEGGKHRQVPAPAPDPGRRGMGNVSITLWFDHVQPRGIVYFDYGQGKLHRASYAPGGSWDAIVPVGQSVYGLVVPFVAGQKGRIHLAIVNNANGTIICEDSNDDKDQNGGSDCGGVALV